jgi:hypothetical protein
MTNVHIVIIMCELKQLTLRCMAAEDKAYSTNCERICFNIVTSQNALFVNKALWRNYVITQPTWCTLHFHYTLLMFNVSTCFGHYLPILRRHYTDAELVTILCSCRCGLVSGYRTWDQPTSTTARNSHQLCVRVVPPEDGQVMSETCRNIEHQ